MQESKSVVMVIDSSQTICNLMGVILPRAGYDIIQSGSVIEARYRITHLPPDLIFIADTVTKPCTPEHVLAGLATHGAQRDHTPEVI